MRRLFWMIVYPFARLAHRTFGLSYKWVNVGKAAWHRELFDPLWHYEWFGDPIDEMPDSVNVCGIRFSVSVSEGLVTFRSDDVWERLEFTRDPHDKYAALWYFEKTGHVPATHIDTAYRYVKAVYGGSHERKKAPLARSSLLTPILAAVLLLLGVSGCGEKAGEHRESPSVESGRRAYRAGIPACANPYQGQSTIHANNWLSGYIDAKTAAEAK